MEKVKTMSQLKAKHGDLIAITGELGSSAIKKKTKDNRFEINSSEYALTLSIIKKIQYFAQANTNNIKGLMLSLREICQASQLGAKISLEQLPVNRQVKNESSEWSNLALFAGNVGQICFTFKVSDLYKLPDNCTVIGQMGCGNQVKVFSNNQEVNIKDNHGLLHCKTVD